MRTIMVVVLGLALAACTSKSNEGAGGGGASSQASVGSGSSHQPDCHAFCLVIEGSECEEQIALSDCEDGCAQSLEVCPTDGAALVSCGISTSASECDQDGYPEPAGCDDALEALAECEQASGSSGTGAGNGSTTGGSNNTTSTTTGSPESCIPPNVGGCGNGVSCCVYAGSGSNPASVPVCKLETGDCCIPSGDGCSDDSQCCVGLSCLYADPGDPSMGSFCK